MLKKTLLFFGTSLYAIGLIGGVGSALYCKAYPCAVGCALLGVMAFPKAKEWFNQLMN